MLRPGLTVLVRGFARPKQPSRIPVNRAERAVLHRRNRQKGAAEHGRLRGHSMRWIISDRAGDVRRAGPVGGACASLYSACQCQKCAGATQCSIESRTCPTESEEQIFDRVHTRVDQGRTQDSCRPFEHHAKDKPRK